MPLVTYSSHLWLGVQQGPERHMNLAGAAKTRSLFSVLTHSLWQVSPGLLTASGSPAAVQRPHSESVAGDFHQPHQCVVMWPGEVTAAVEASVSSPVKKP